MTQETFLVTGAFGCIGANILHLLVDEGVQVVASDLGTDPVRPRLLLTQQAWDSLTFVQADVTELAQVLALVEEHPITHIIHLAGLQVPFCRANPSLGAQVNVVGTVNIFEAARRHQDQVEGLAYASSIAALGPPAMYPDTPVPDDVPLRPDTLYGVYKQANEHTARLYWQDWQVGSIGLRPYIVYGLGRDQGMTSDLTKAILAAAAGRPYHIKFGGLVALQSAGDVARMFVESARRSYQGAAACNLRNDVVTVEAFIDALKAEVPAAEITYEADASLPFPAELDDGGLRQILGHIPHTPLQTEIRQILDQFKTLLKEDRIDLSQLDG